MKAFFDVLAIISALAMFSRHAGVDFVTEHYWGGGGMFLIGIIGRTLCDKTMKKNLNA